MEITTLERRRYRRAATDLCSLKLEGDGRATEDSRVRQLAYDLKLSVLKAFVDEAANLFESPDDAAFRAAEIRLIDGSERTTATRFEANYHVLSVVGTRLASFRLVTTVIVATIADGRYRRALEAEVQGLLLVASPQ